MTEEESFLARWSRRKHEAATRVAASVSEDAATEEASAKTDHAASAPSSAAACHAPAEPSDAAEIADLPSLDAITADTDIRGFLRPGVPEEVRRAALRRAWSADPAIRDFVGPVENGWDFNDPNAMAGFGPIAQEDVARLITQVVDAVHTPPAETQVVPRRPAMPSHAQTTDTSKALPARADAAEDHTPLHEPSAAAMQQDSDMVAARQQKNAES